MPAFAYYKTPDDYDYPSAEVKLSYRGKVSLVYPLVDSGAGISIFSQEVASELGINIRRGKLVDLSGIGGQINGFVHKINLTIGNDIFRASVVFSSEMSQDLNLLGRKDVFEQFMIKFDEKNKRTIFKKRRFWHNWFT